MNSRILAISLVTEIVLVLSGMLDFKGLSAILAGEDMGWSILKGWSWLTSLAFSFLTFFVGPNLVRKIRELAMPSSDEEDFNANKKLAL